MTIDKIDYPDIKSEIESIFDGIREAEQKLMNAQIRANCVVIDRKYIGALKPFIVNCCGHQMVSQPVMGGLKVFFDVLPDDVAFLVMESDNLPQSELERLRAENEDLKQQIATVKIALGLDGDID